LWGGGEGRIERKVPGLKEDGELARSAHQREEERSRKSMVLKEKTMGDGELRPARFQKDLIDNNGRAKKKFQKDIGGVNEGL
jgi:hypothetical protein